MYGLSRADETQNCHLSGRYLQKRPKQTGSDQLSDEQLLQQALEGVVPLKNPERSDSRKPRRPLSKPTYDHNESAPEPSELSETEAALSIDSDNSHRKHGVQTRVLKRLKRGHYPLEDQFDLHHLNMRTGKSALLEFINWSCRQNLKCIRVIHGKGLRSADGPKLKIMARDILRNHPKVMAFTSCKQNEGGDGATDILLK